MEKQRGVERVIFLTDAVVAIAITLLILPLVEIVTTDANKPIPVPVSQFLFDNLSQLFAFTLSFVIIARFWVANHPILLNTVRGDIGAHVARPRVGLHDCRSAAAD
jgi:uncharacterized membrane protein